MARTQSTRRKTRKGSKKLTDDKRVSQVMFKDPATLTEAERASQAFFNDPETIKVIEECQAARAKMNKEEKEAEVDGIRQQLGMLPKAVSMTAKKRGKPESPYEADTTEEADMTNQVATPAPGDPIEIGDDNDNDNDGWSHDQHGQDKDEDNISLTQPPRLQGCENDPDNKELFSDKSNDDNDDNDPDEEYSQPSNGADKKKRSKRKTPTSTILTPRISQLT